MVYVKGFVVTANYQDVTPGLLLTVADYMDSLKPSYARDSIDHAAMEMLRRAAADLASKSARDAEAAELEALGGTEAAERGWNALRKHNPNVDKSNGSPGGEIVSFSDLSHRQKVNYAVFAAGVLDVVKRGRVFTGPTDEPPAGVNLLIGNDPIGPNYVRRTKAGWWWVDSPDETVGDKDGWQWRYLTEEDFPLTEVIS